LEVQGVLKIHSKLQGDQKNFKKPYPEQEIDPSLTTHGLNKLFFVRLSL